MRARPRRTVLDAFLVNLGSAPTRDACAGCGLDQPLRLPREKPPAKVARIDAGPFDSFKQGAEFTDREGLPHKFEGHRRMRAPKISNEAGPRFVGNLGVIEGQ